MADDAHAAAEEAVADMIFGPDPTKEEATEAVTEEETTEVEETEEVEESTEETEEEPKPVPEGEENVEFEWDGQIIEAPQNIKDALMRNKDYTEKTQANATDRKELEIQRGNLDRLDSQYKFAVSVQDDVMKAHQLDTQIEQARVYMRENIDGMTHTDLEKIRMAIDETRSERDKIINDVRNKSTEHQQAHEQTLTELMTKSTEVLKQKIPGWTDDSEGQLRAYALEQGIPEQTYNAVVDPLEKVILHKAMQFDALKSGVTSAVKAVQSAPTIKPKSRSPMPKDTQDHLTLRKKIKNTNRSASARAEDIGMDVANRFKL
jgi:hypothetical protein